MNKRSAIGLAGGVAGALVSGVAGYSARLGQSQEAAAAPKPIVRTQIQTITIHRKPKPVKTSAHPQTVVLRRTPSVASTGSPAIHHTGGSAAHGGDGEGDGGDRGGD